MIYFVRCGSDGPIKIGHTIGDVQSRISFLQVGCPWPLTAVSTMDGDLDDEARLHRDFAHLNIRGEWFHPAKDLLAFIEAGAVAAAPKLPRKVFELPLATVKPESDEDWPAILGEIMRLANFSQTDLARHLGTHQAQISKWCSGKHGPSAATRTHLRALLQSLRPSAAMVNERSAA